jgi:hypothetical protein
MSFIADVCLYLESINVFFKFKVSGVPESCPACLHSQLFHFPHILEVPTFNVSSAEGDLAHS